ncbi:Probable low-affinity inorganic phosphate transporter [hydrothermal vent metagenome]|uniref:Probable low-affinity inorganic phosphate transporter n=1 Tax=hydrothermal vent metagenome TaxID=652676 RepID=A0A3B0Z2S0_9ZZZZ
MEYGLIFLILAVAFGLFMAWGVGANDVANAMATSVGSKAITIKQAIIIAAIFEFAGAFLAGGEVTSTIRKGMVDTALLADTPELLVYGMLASLLSAGIWLFIATRFGWPVSTTHTIVGAIVGFAAVGIGIDAVQWGKVGSIAMSWIVSPLVAGIIAFLLFVSVQRLIFDTDNPFQNARRYVPFYIFLVGFVVALVTIFKGLKHIGLNLSIGEGYAVALLFGLAITWLGWLKIRKIKIDPVIDRDFHFASVEKIFAVLMMATACAMAFAHGSNDVANAIGPVAAIVSIVESGGMVTQQSALPIWVLLIGAGGIVVGLITYGHKVIATVGTEITELTPSRGFCATLAAAATVVLASGTGMPISTTQTLVGAVLGVGLARGIAALNLVVIRKIFMSWIITLPVGAFMSIVFFFILKAIFS